MTVLNGIWSRFERFVPRELSALACNPADRLTPMASRMTTKAKKKDKANMSEDTPLDKPIDVTIEMTKALWLEGMPPVFQNNVENNSRMPVFLRESNTMRALANCAIKRLIAAARNTSFLRRAERASAL